MQIRIVAHHHHQQWSTVWQSKVQEVCAKLHITHKFTSVGHPQSNDKAEVTNQIILHDLMIWLNDAKGLWVEELYLILWTYDMEAMILVEIGLSSMRVQQYAKPTNSDCQRANLNLLQEVWQQAQIRIAVYRQRVAQYYNTKIKPRVFHPGDLVLRKVEVSKDLDQEKLSSYWKGLYKVIETLHLDAYRLEILDGMTVPWTWNTDNLRMYI